MTLSSSTLPGVQAALINLNHPGYYLHWGVIQISLANFIVILVMVAIFGVALFMRFPGGRGQ